jgi:nitrogen fixation protein NifU and related proteins
VKLEQMYQEIILDHYRSPHRAGLREPFDAESFQINPTCGDEITLRVALEGDTVSDVSYETLGCSISQASASVLTDLVVGRSVTDSMKVLAAFQEMAQGRGQVTPDEEVLGDGVAFAGVARYPARVKCALLGWMAFKDAVVRSFDDGSAADIAAAGKDGVVSELASSPFTTAALGTGPTSDSEEGP